MTCESIDKVNCTACYDGYTLSNDGGSCVANVGDAAPCAPGYFKDNSTGSTGECTACSKGCKHCDSAGGCLECRVGDWVRDETTCAPYACDMTCVEGG